MNRTGLYVVIGVLAAVLLMVLVAYWNETNNDTQLTIGAGENGISIEVNE